jgi:hypothetical protein
LKGIEINAEQRGQQDGTAGAKTICESLAVKKIFYLPGLVLHYFRLQRCISIKFTLKVRVWVYEDRKDGSKDQEPLAV